MIKKGDIIKILSNENSYKFNIKYVGVVAKVTKVFSDGRVCAREIDTEENFVGKLEIPFIYPKDYEIMKNG